MPVFYYDDDRDLGLNPETLRCIRLVILQINGTPGDDRLVGIVRAMQVGAGRRKQTDDAERARCVNIARSQQRDDATDDRIRAIIDGINNGEDTASDEA